ncbi:hypothetical protein [Halorubrum trueperi]|uniref:Uncharacterized protein n=1 Tax=Halorubrum trueperi TaxID=2004704 RepID=A0ABD5UHR2_9EURY
MFGGDAADDVLRFLARHRDESFSMTEIAEAVGYSRLAADRNCTPLTR